MSKVVSEVVANVEKGIKVDSEGKEERETLELGERKRRHSETNGAVAEVSEGTVPFHLKGVHVLSQGASCVSISKEKEKQQLRQLLVKWEKWILNRILGHILKPTLFLTLHM